MTELTSPSQRFGARLQRPSSAAALQARVIEQETRTLAEAFERVASDGSVVAAAATVVAARRRFVAGTGKSFAYASLLAVDLSAGLSNVTLVDGTLVRHLDVLADVRDTDVLVAVSLRRYRRETVALAGRFAAAGGTVVAVTDTAASPLTAVAGQSIVVPTASASFADSPTAVAAVLHLLATLTTASAKGARRRLAERDRLAHDLDLYWED
ncbi:MurR/RpiR family transcriptional regulator [Jiangella rhizosphaerae]|uniref:MurR/RpiR family transcriptional regulator n=1 Tax=Jiangella rhizosphaerae TaxID=2293569 RepID=A0A418KXM7_9ACTN|nr:SIS domain-containing protein [Jiangella rhizosphaerae]RIQ35760.1 MurR/RpiR family transcriptional regulator [Jiangella rhizosphaerae]